MSSLDDFAGKQATSRGSVNAGSCAVVAVLLEPSRLFMAHVGDCRAVCGTSEPIHLLKGTISPSRRSRRACLSLQSVDLTKDHNCTNTTEVAKVKARSGDKKAIRSSKGKGPPRVAGSLAITRALGDAYLKLNRFSFPPYIEKLPYITAEPEVNCFQLTEDDKFLVIATDGLWELCSSQEVVLWVDGWCKRGSNEFAHSADFAIASVLKAAAAASNMKLSEVKGIPPGAARRKVHDDMTLTVIQLQGRRHCKDKG
ncbi:unnamed protein product [Chrysoparadoxa australica]